MPPKWGPSVPLNYTVDIATVMLKKISGYDTGNVGVWDADNPYFVSASLVRLLQNNSSISWKFEIKIIKFGLSCNCWFFCFK